MDEQAENVAVAQEAPGMEWSEDTLVVEDLSARCVFGTHPKHGVYIQAFQCRKGSLYPHTGSSWSSHGEKGPGFCHNPESPLILPVWEWMKEAGFSEDQMKTIQTFLAAHDLVQSPVGEANVNEANF